MPPSHRHGDSRVCGATTVVEGQSSVFVNGRLWAVHGDPNTHGAGDLIASGQSVTINGIRVIVHRADSAEPDDLCPVLNINHCDPETAEGSASVSAYG